MQHVRAGGHTNVNPVRRGNLARRRIDVPTAAIRGRESIADRCRGIEPGGASKITSEGEIDTATGLGGVAPDRDGLALDERDGAGVAVDRHGGDGEGARARVRVSSRLPRMTAARRGSSFQRPPR